MGADGLQNWQNRTLFHGDNLPFLRGMNSNSVHLIATDPPFNKNRDFHATPDSPADGASFQDRWSWERDVHEEWVDQIRDDFPHVMEVINGSRASYGDDMGAFLCFMGVRLLEMKRVLREDGSIYLHCDPTAGHYLKELMDAVFGRKNFRNEIVWHYTGGGRSKTYFSRKHDTILLYSKGKAYTFNVDEIRVPYKETSGYAKSGITAKSGKKYMPNPKGTPIDDVWDIPIINPLSKERTGYPTQKPLVLYERIIRASSNKNDIVLDPFCGCATTPVAAERLGRQWAGIDIWNKTHETIIRRLQSEGLAAPDGDTGGQLLTKGQIGYETLPPVRTDDGQEAVPFLKTRRRVEEPKGPKMSRTEMYDILLSKQGSRCQGCDRVFDDPRYLELDHNTPRSDGGLNHISNRVLLCGPCNKLKSNIYTLSGLRRENAKRGYMAKLT